MININKLNKKSIGKWVVYVDPFGKGDEGKIKSWNDKYVFVVYKAVDWNLFENYTAAATKPEDLSFANEIKMDSQR